MGYIYKIENTINGKVYIGQTKRTILKRWQEHIYSDPIHSPNTKLSRAFKKYGINSFNVSLVEECDNSILDERERYWIKFYDSFKNGYNCTLGGSEGVNVWDYEELANAYIKNGDLYKTAKEFGIKVQGLKQVLDSYKLSYNSLPAIEAIPVEMIDMKTLEVIKTFPSLTDASAYFNKENPEKHCGTISAAISGKRASAYGYYWRKKGDNTKEFNSKANPRCKVIQCDKNTGEEIQVFNSTAEANRACGKPSNHKSIGNVLRGSAKTAFGYIWKKG